VPNVLGETLADAIDIVHAAGLTVVDDGVPEGDATGEGARVPSQEPHAGRTGAAGCQYRLSYARLMHTELTFRGRVKHDLAMEDRGRWWVFDRPLWRDPLFVIGIGVGLISVVCVILLRDEYGTGAFVFALLTSLPAGVFASGVVIGTAREYMRGRRQGTP
jgi:hypothetical protein